MSSGRELAVAVVDELVRAGLVAPEAEFAAKVEAGKVVSRFECEGPFLQLTLPVPGVDGGLWL